MERKKLTEFTLRDCQRAHTGSAVVMAEETQAALAVLIDRGYLQAAPLPAREPGVMGRPNSPIYAVNPATHGRHANGN